MSFYKMSHNICKLNELRIIKLGLVKSNSNFFTYVIIIICRYSGIGT